METILITGGAGFIGVTLTELLLEKGYRVLCYDTLQFGPDPVLPFFRHDNYELMVGDIRDTAELGRAAMKAAAIVHLAAIVGSPACDREPELALETNVGGMRNLLSVRSPDQPILFASTGSVYGPIRDLCTEETPIHPPTLYGQSKAEAEKMLMDSGRGVALRLATGFGLSPSLRLDLLINQLAYQAARGLPLVLYEPHFKRTFLHVRDIARAFLFALERFSKMRDSIYNAGDERLNISKLDAARVIQELSGCETRVAEQGHDADQRNYEVSYARVRRLGFEASVSLRTGIAEMIRAFRHVPDPKAYRSAA